MPRMMVFLITLMFVLPSHGSAQAGPSPGDRIRVKQVDGTTLTGTFSTRSAGAIQLSVGAAGPMVEVPVEGIAVLETSLGRQRRFGKYFGLTLAATSIVGATIGFIVYEDSGPCSFLCFGPDTRTEYIALGFAYGALVGLPLGAIIGYAVREERWNRVALAGLAESRLSIRPVIGSRVGLVASVRVGGF